MRDVYKTSPEKRQFLRALDVNKTATSCTCGGPGGRPGMAPVCPACLKFSFIGERVAMRQRPANQAVLALLSRFTLARGTA